MYYPDYSYLPDLFPSVALDVTLLRHRDFHKDAKACIENLNPPLQVLRKENIPQQGPCVITVHYHRAGFGAQEDSLEKTKRCATARPQCLLGWSFIHVEYNPSYPSAGSLAQLCS